METFFPSEVARLVLGYLKEEKCLKTWQTFLEESSNLEEYCNLYKKGRVYSTNVNGYSLLDVLNEYCALKSQVICNNNKSAKSPEQVYHISESEFLEAIRKDVFLETTKNATDSVFQKYLSLSALNNQNSSSPNSPTKVQLSKSRSSSLKNKENENSHNTDKNGLNADEHGKKLDKVPDHTNERETYIIDKNKNKICSEVIDLDLNASKTDTKVNISGKSNNSLKPLEISNNKHQQSDCTVINDKVKNSADTSTLISRQLRNQDSQIINPAVSDGSNINSHMKHKSYTSGKKSSTSNSDYTIKENAISSTESSQNDVDVELEIIKEVNIEKINSGIQLAQSHNCQSDLMINNPSQNNLVINVEKISSNNVTVNQATVCSVQSPLANFDSSKQNENSSESNPVRNIQVDNNLPIKLNQVVARGLSTEANQNYNPEHAGNSSVDQTNSNINTSSFLNKPTIVDKLPSTSARFLLPTYSSSDSFVNNNAQFYIVLNTPINSNVGGTYITLPRIQTNVSNPVLPAVSTACVNNSVSAVSGVSNLLPTIAPAVNRISVPASKTNLVNSHENFLTTSKVSEPTAKTGSIIRTSQTEPRVLKRVSYAAFLDSDSDTSVSLMTSKKKKIRKKLPPKKKSNTKDSIHSTEQIDVLNVTQLPEIQKGSKEKKNKKSKKKSEIVSRNLFDKNLEVNKQGASCIQFKQLPINTSSKNLGIEQSNKVFGISVSSCSDIHDNSQSIVSKTGSEDLDQSAVFNGNRVLKVVLSDVFQNSKLESNASCNQYPESNLVRDDEKADDQVSNSKQTVQNRKSPRKHKTYSKHLNESSNTGTIKFQQTTNANNLPSIVKKKQYQSIDKNDSNNSFSMTTAVLKSMEQARQLVTNPKKHSASVTIKELNFQNSSKNIAGHTVKSKSASQTAVQDFSENVRCTEFETRDMENILFVSEKGAPAETESNLKSSLNKSSTADNDTVILSCYSNNKNMKSSEVTVCSENIASLSKNSDFEKCCSLPEKILKKDLELKETGGIISLEVNSETSSDTINANGEIADTDCTKEKKLLLTNSISSVHQVNLRKMKTCVARKLNFGDKAAHINTTNNALEEEDSRNSSCEVFKAESGTFNSVNIEDCDSNFIQHTKKTSVFSVLTSISTNTKVLDITEMHNVAKPHSDVLGVSSLRGNNTINVILPSTSDQTLESEKCVFTALCPN